MAKTSREACNLLVKFDGQEQIKASASGGSYKLQNGMNVASLSIDQRLDAPDTFELELAATAEGQRVVFDFVKEGAKVELGMGFEKPVTPIFKGEVNYVEAEFDVEEGATVVVRGYDAYHRLTRGHAAKTWGDGAAEDQKFSDVVSDVISNSKDGKAGTSDGLSTDKVDATDFQVRYVPRAMATSYDFIKHLGGGLARATDSSATDDKKIGFRKLDISQGPVCTVCYDKQQGSEPVGTIRARFSIATYPSYAKVRVHGWDTAKKQAFVGEVENCSSEIDGSSANSGWEAGWKVTGKALYGSGGSGAVYERVAEFCATKQEAEKIAQGIFDSFALRHLTGEVTCEGMPKIVPGCTVEFKGFGKRVDGKVLVTQASHTLSARGSAYTTTFQFVSTASGKA